MIGSRVFLEPWLTVRPPRQKAHIKGSSQLPSLPLLQHILQPLKSSTPVHNQINGNHLYTTFGPFLPLHLPRLSQ